MFKVINYIIQFLRTIEQIDYQVITPPCRNIIQ